MKKYIENSVVIRFLRNSPKTTIGITLLLIVLIMTLGANLFTTYDPQYRFPDLWHAPPSKEHLLGTTRLGKDVFAQTLYGGRVSLMVGVLAGSIAVALSLVIGISAGYFGGLYDSVVSTVINIIMVIPQVVILLVIAAVYRGVSPMMIGVIIGLTSWPFNARILRAQTMSIRNREFVYSAETLGEKKWRILFVEIMPNMLSMIASAFVGTIIYAIMAQTFIEFIGLGDASSVTWGQMIHNAQKTNALQSKIWWEILGPSVGIITVGTGLTLINFAIDEISNPKLKAQRIMSTYYKVKKKQEKMMRKSESREFAVSGGSKGGLQ